VIHVIFKKLVGAAAIAATLGLSTVGVGAGVANAATPAPSIPGPVHTAQTPADPAPTHALLVDWHGGGHGGHGGRGGWGDHGDGGRGGWGDRGGWGRGGWGWPGWGWGR
jgi:hypothetical protein